MLMWIVAIAWMYVAVMMAVAEAVNSSGTILGALVTLLLYGVGPLAIVLYLLGTPARRKARRRQELGEQAAAASTPDPDGGAHALGQPSVAAERKEP